MLHLRAYAWGHSMGRLDDVFDFQAHSAGCRSLCEIVVDLALLTKGAESVERMLAWEQREEVRSAKTMAETPSGVQQHAVTFC
jgi:hypothetical protein